MQRNFWFTSAQAAVHLSELTGKAIKVDDVKKMANPLAKDPLPETFGGVPLCNGKLFGPMAIRVMHGRILKKRVDFLMSESHDYIPPILMTHFGKGGSGKTTISVNVAIQLARKGYRILFIDGDSQANATQFFGFDASARTHTLLDVIAPDKNGQTLPLDQVKIPLLENGVLDLIPANHSLVDFERAYFFERMSNERMFEKYVIERNGPSLSQYDLVMIDTNPASGSAINLVMGYAADNVLMPITLEKVNLDSLSGTEYLFSELEKAKSTNRRIIFLLNQYSKLPHAQATMNYLVNTNPDLIMNTIIPVNNAVKRQGWQKGEVHGLTLVEREPNNVVSKKISTAAMEISEKVLWAGKGLKVLKFARPEYDEFKELQGESA